MGEEVIQIKLNIPIKLFLPVTPAQMLVIVTI